MQTVEMSFQARIPEEEITKGVTRQLRQYCFDLFKKQGQAVEVYIPIDREGYQEYLGEYFEIPATTIWVGGKERKVKVQTTTQSFDGPDNRENLTILISVFDPPITYALTDKEKGYKIPLSINEVSYGFKLVEPTPLTTEERNECVQIVERLRCKQRDGV